MTCIFLFATIKEASSVRWSVGSLVCWSVGLFLFVGPYVFWLLVHHARAEKCETRIEKLRCVSVCVCVW